MHPPPSNEHTLIPLQGWGTRCRCQGLMDGSWESGFYILFSVTLNPLRWDWVKDYRASKAKQGETRKAFKSFSEKWANNSLSCRWFTKKVSANLSIFFLILFWLDYIGWTTWDGLRFELTLSLFSVLNLMPSPFFKVGPLFHFFHLILIKIGYQCLMGLLTRYEPRPSST